MLKVNRLAVVFTAIVGLASFSTIHAAVISVNFKGPASQANYTDPANIGPSVTTAAGAVQVTGWNNAQGPTNTLNSLLDDTSTPTSANLTYTSSNVYNAYTAPPSGTGDNALMQGYLDNFSGTANIVVSGLGSAFTSGGYQVLVYQNADSAGSFGYSITDNNSNTNFAYGKQSAGNGANYPLGGTNGYVSSISTSNQGPATAANYVILTGFTGSTFTLTGLSGGSGDGRPRINGFQIVAAPEPASLGLIGLASLGFLSRRRRR